MEPLSLTSSDLCHHVVTFGMDVYPPVEMAQERTRLNIFYEEARSRWPKLYQSLAASDSDFRISAQFRRNIEVSGPSLGTETFVLAPRGPVFIFPLVLPDPVGPTTFNETYRDDFDNVRQLFFDKVAKRTIMRVGLVRDLLFSTGSTRCERLLTRQGSFADAELVGGNLLLSFKDSLYNYHVLSEPVTIAKTTRLAVGTMINEPAGYGLHVRLDVNNADLQKPLQEPDIQGILDRATCLWPEELLNFLRELESGA